MCLNEWYRQREIFLTGITSEFGRAILEKILRLFPNVNVYTVVRSRNSLLKEDRINQIFSSPGFERLRQEQPDAISRVKVFEGNLLYDDLGLKLSDLSHFKNIDLVFHAAGPFDHLLDFCHDSLPKLKAIALTTSLFKPNNVIDDIRNEKFLNIPITVLQFPIIGPAYKEPMPGFVEIMRGPTAIMVGAGYALGRSDLPAEVIPIDYAVNGLIIAAWERGIRNKNDIPAIYNMPNLGCTWGELIKKGQMAQRKFPYPTFGIRGMTSIAFLHWMVVFFLEWLPSAFCDNVLTVFGRKPRCLGEYVKVHEALKSLEEVITKPWFADRIRIHQVEDCLTLMDHKNFPVRCDIDLDEYSLCVAASARKNCINEDNIKIVKTFNGILKIILSLIVFYFIFQIRI